MLNDEPRFIIAPPFVAKIRGLTNADFSVFLSVCSFAQGPEKPLVWAKSLTISKRAGLSPGTVSKSLKWLMHIGLLREFNEPFGGDPRFAGKRVLEVAWEPSDSIGMTTEDRVTFFARRHPSRRKQQIELNANRRESFHGGNVSMVETDAFHGGNPAISTVERKMFPQEETQKNRPVEETSTNKPPTSLDHFESSWRTWPKARLRNKAATLKAWSANKADGGAKAAAVARYLSSKEARKDGGQYVPNFNKWIAEQLSNWLESESAASVQTAHASPSLPSTPDWWAIAVKLIHDRDSQFWRAWGAEFEPAANKRTVHARSEAAANKLGAKLSAIADIEPIRIAVRSKGSPAP